MRKTVAGKYVNASQTTGSHTHSSQILECSAAATRNLALAHRAPEMGHTPRWLHSGLHCLFNASIILLLDTVLSGSWTDEDTEHLNFAKQAFRQAAFAMDGYTGDCLNVLCNLETLVQKIQGQCVFQSQTHAAGVPQGQLEGQPKSDECFPELTCPQPAQGYSDPPQASDLELDDSLIDELVNWLQVDGMQMYGT